MTVAQLISRLRDFPLDADVLVEARDSGEPYNFSVEEGTWYAEMTEQLGGEPNEYYARTDVKRFKEYSTKFCVSISPSW
jgi:hypothetical protein